MALRTTSTTEWPCFRQDGDYGLEDNWNWNYETDLYHAAGASTINVATIPNTDTYQAGNIFQTFNSVSQISAAGATMSLRFDDATGACCFGSDADPPCMDLAADTCFASDGTYHGNYTMCGPIGACCFDSNGSCELLAEYCCIEMDGRVSAAPRCLGDGDGNGIDGACEQGGLGACCLENLSCTTTTEAECGILPNAMFRGVDKECQGDSNDDGIDEECEDGRWRGCCRRGGSCDNTIWDACEGIEGTPGAVFLGQWSDCAYADDNNNGVDDACEHVISLDVPTMSTWGPGDRDPPAVSGRNGCDHPSASTLAPNARNVTSTG